MKTKFLFFLILFFGVNFCLSAQVQNLEIIGQTPGGGGYVVHWDEDNSKLIVGCGVSVWVYDMTDAHNPVKIQKRPLVGQINEFEIRDNVLFVAATHDGIYALDYTKTNLDILDHFSMKDMQGVAAYGMHLYNDIIYVADNTGVRMFTFNEEDGFEEVGFIVANKAFGVHRKGDFIAVCCQWNPLVTDGKIKIFSINNFADPIAEFTDTLINSVQAIQFSDLKDDIVFVCGGPENALFHKSHFFAYQFNENTIMPIDTFTIVGGIPLVAQYNIINMDSRNDTIYIATTAAYDIMHIIGDSVPCTYIPIIDASGLPEQKMDSIGKISPGFWHFDVSLMHGTPYVAMSSEWFGVVISDTADHAFLDTVRILPTGGWVEKSTTKHNYLWVCNEGHGITVHNPDSLLFENGFWCDSQVFRFGSTYENPDNHFFAADIGFK